MAKDPAFLFYSSDFLTGTLLMSMEDRGKYITILAYMHQNGRLSDETIRLLVGSVSDTLRLKFGLDKNGLWFNERLEIEVEKRQSFVSSRKENGKKGGRPPKKHTLLKDENKKPTNNLPEDENINENKIEDDNIIIEASKKILTDFGFNEIRNINHLRKISDFLRVLKSQNRLDYFIEIYPAYWEYKKLSGSEPQMLETFLNDGWDRANWPEKLNEIKNKPQGKTNPVSRLEQAQRLYESTRKG